MHRRSVLLTVLFVALLALTCVTQTANLNPEEITVRTTYAKLAYAAKIKAVHNLLAAYEGQNATPATTVEVRDRVASEELRFSISNFTLHPVNDASMKYSEIVTKPTGKILGIAQGTFERVEHGTKYESATANVVWRNGADAIEENWDIPANEAFAQGENAALYTRYGAYTVTVTFHGRSRTYNAAFLFGMDNGKEKYLPVDLIVGNSALEHFATTKVYPEHAGQDQPKGTPGRLRLAEIGK